MNCFFTFQKINKERVLGLDVTFHLNTRLRLIA